MFYFPILYINSAYVLEHRQKQKNINRDVTEAYINKYTWIQKCQYNSLLNKTEGLLNYGMAQTLFISKRREDLTPFIS